MQAATEKLTNSLSVVLITLNAATQLEACLASVQGWVSEIVVVDSGSQDGTVELAERMGARVIQQAWLGFGPQKQFAVEQASHDWVLCLDADERVSPDLQKSILAQMASDGINQFAAYRFARCNRFLGRYLRHGEGYPDWSARLFNRKQARWSDDAVHEKVLVDGLVGVLQGDLLHDSAESLSAYLTKQNRYTSLAAEEAFQRGRRSGWLRVAFSPVVRFVKFYIVRAGFRDGLPGFVHIAIGCFNSFCKYAKLLELQRAAIAQKTTASGS